MQMFPTPGSVARQLLDRALLQRDVRACHHKVPGYAVHQSFAQGAVYPVGFFQ